MADEFPVKFTTVRDDTRYELGNEIVREKLYVFYLGKRGPFTERVPLENFDEYEITRRVEKMRAHLVNLPK